LLLVLAVAILVSDSRRLKGAADEAGCEGVGALVDIETARAEARYVPIEVVAVMGLGLGMAFQYGSQTGEVLAAQLQGQSVPQGDCYSIDVVNPVDLEGNGAVAFDFAQCESRGGSVTVHQGKTTLPEIPALPGSEGRDDGIEIPTDGSIPEGLPEDLEGLQDLTEEELQELVDSILEGSASAAVGVVYDDYNESLLNIEGGITLSSTVALNELTPGAGGSEETLGGAAGLPLSLTKGTLETDIATSVFDYAGTAVLAGPFSVDPDTMQSTINLDGTFTSTTGLEWEIIINDLVIGGDCLGAVSGNINAIYDGPSGRVDVVATANGACDGCIQMEVDGVEQPDLCLPDIVMQQTGAG
tara:strand:+ start:161 stop:1231 length:1071 start_codon:yes stop_codon:yes gene_type:complete